jgi:hypothetical protein
MKHCWSREPTRRPTTTDVVSYFQLILNGGVDQRPLDKFDTHSFSRILISEAEHPFAVLSPPDDDGTILQDWKHAFVDREIGQPSFSHLDASDWKRYQGDVDQTMVDKKDRASDFACEYEWQIIARRKQCDREVALAKFADSRIEVGPEVGFDVLNLPFEKLLERERCIVRYDATALADLIRKRLYTSVEVLIAFAKAAVVAQDVTNCLTEIFIEEALNRSLELDRYIEHSGNVVGPLHGQLNFV